MTLWPPFRRPYLRRTDVSVTTVPLYVGLDDGSGNWLFDELENGIDTEYYKLNYVKQNKTR